MAQYGGGYGQTNPYESSGRYDQEAGNPYAQKPAYGGRQQQEQQQGAYDGYDNRYGQGQAAGGGGYVGGNDVEMTPMNGDSNAFGVPASRDPNAILNECRDIDKGVDSIQRNLERLRFLQQRAIDDPDASQGTATNRELDSLSSDTMTLYRSFAARIKSIKQQKESGDPRNKPQVGMVDRKLKSAINEYQQVDRDFRHKLSAQMERQYRIVRPDASDHEVQEAIQDTSNNQVFSQALLSQNRRGQSQSALRAVQGRHEAIQKIERQMIELAQLFQDMEAAVVQQEPAIEHIDNKAEDTVVHLNKGNEQLDQAVDKARAARRKKWICLGIVVLIIIIIVAIVIIVVEVTKPKKYQMKLAQRPLLTQSITTAVLFATGDVMAQQAVEKVGFDKHNLARTGRMALYGGAIFGPAATTWFAFLARRINFPSRPNLTIAARVLTDQTVFASLNLGCFLSSMAIMEGSDPRQKLESTYWTALQKNWMLWPAVQAINFKLVPLEHRVLVVNVVSLGWNCYLSYVNSQGGAKAEKEEKKLEEKVQEKIKKSL